MLGKTDEDFSLSSPVSLKSNSLTNSPRATKGYFTFQDPFDVMEPEMSQKRDEMDPFALLSR